MWALSKVRTNFSGTHIQAWHVQALYVGGYRIVPLTDHATLTVYWAISHHDGGEPQNILPSVPSLKGIGLVCAYEQVQIGLWLFSFQLFKCLYRVGCALAIDLACVHQRLRHISKGQTRHGQSMGRRCECAGLVPCVARWHDAQLGQAKLFYRMLRQRDVRGVGRVKRTAKHAKSRLVVHAL